MVDGVRVELSEGEIDQLVDNEAQEAKRAEDYAKIKYKDDRRAEYPVVGDQLDDLYRKGAFSNDMAAQIKAIKDKHPKPE